jgi:hypothetical protein
VYVQVNVCFLCFGCILIFSTLVARFVLIHKFVGRHEEYPVTGLPISRKYLAEEEYQIHAQTNPIVEVTLGKTIYAKR